MMVIFSLGGNSMKGGARQGAGRKMMEKADRRRNITISATPRTIREMELLHGQGVNISAEFNDMIHQLCHDLELIEGDIVV